ncbi:MAG: RpiB/LacA/LacB family sugar-phosphate isomerase [bacterium]
MPQTIYIGADHAGFDMKKSICEHLDARGFIVEDLGAHSLDPADDYPQFAESVADAVVEHSGALGVLSCGNAEGVCIAANKIDGVRAGVGYSVDAARTMRSDDDANIICIPGRLDIPDDPLMIVDAYVDTPFSDAPRHNRRLDQINKLEEEQK